MDLLFMLHFNKEPELNCHINLFISNDKFYSKSGKEDQPSWSIGEKSSRAGIPPGIAACGPQKPFLSRETPSEKKSPECTGSGKISHFRCPFTGCALADFTV